MGGMGGVLNTPPSVIASADTRTAATMTAAATAGQRRNILGGPGCGSSCFRASSSSRVLTSPLAVCGFLPPLKKPQRLFYRLPGCSSG